MGAPPRYHAPRPTPASRRPRAPFSVPYYSISSGETASEQEDTPWATGSRGAAAVSVVPDTETPPARAKRPDAVR